MRPITLSVSPRAVALVSFGITVALVVGHVAFTVGSEVTGHPLCRLPRFCNLGGEANRPAYFSAANLLLSAGLLARIVEGTFAFTEASSTRLLANTVVEEGAGMAGVSLFNVVLVGHLARLGARLAVGFEDREVAGIPLHDSGGAPVTEAEAAQLA